MKTLQHTGRIAIALRPWVAGGLLPLEPPLPDPPRPHSKSARVATEITMPAPTGPAVGGFESSKFAGVENRPQIAPSVPVRFPQVFWSPIRW